MLCQHHELCILLVRAANSFDFYIEFKFEFEISLFYECEFESCENLSSFFRVQKVK